MPELPDVEVFKQYLDSTSLHQRIDSLSILDEDVIQDVSARVFRRHLVGSVFERTWRHGKYLFVRLPDEWMVMHFGMTGRLEYYKREEKEPRFARVIVEFENDYRLAYDCMRKLEFLTLTSERSTYLKDKELGPDAFSLSEDEFAEALGRSRGMVQSSLMNQKLMAGVGNVYSDEILFQAGIHPKRPGGAQGPGPRGR